MGQVIPFPVPHRRPYEAAALDRLIAEVQRRREPRAVGDGLAHRPRVAGGTVVPFRLADR